MMISKKITFKFSWSQIINYYKLATIIINIGLLIYTILFLYDNFYTTIDQIKIIESLKGEVVGSKIDMSLYKKVTEDIKNKKTPPEIKWKELKNPFLPYSYSEVQAEEESGE